MQSIGVFLGWSLRVPEIGIPNVRVFVLHPGITPLRNKMAQLNTVLSGNVPKWGQYPVGVFPGCNTKTLRPKQPPLALKRNNKTHGISDSRRWRSAGPICGLWPHYLGVASKPQNGDLEKMATRTKTAAFWWRFLFDPYPFHHQSHPSGWPEGREPQLTLNSPN